MPHCSNCESHVSEDFHRVFSVDGEVHSCPNCPEKATSNIGSNFSPK